MPDVRNVSRIYPARMVDMGGILIRQPLPGPGLDQIDPFLLLHHGDLKISPDMEPRHAGVGPHPHRGFSPVTFIFKGGVQWMNAGMGLIHSERPPEDIQAVGGQMEIIQLWVNTPSRHKMDIPEYFPLQKSEIPRLHGRAVSAANDQPRLHGRAVSAANDQLVLKTGDPNVLAALVAGEMFGETGPITSHLKNKIEITALMLEMQAGGKLTVPIPAGHNAFVYLLDGSADFGNGERVFGKNLVRFSDEGGSIQIKAMENTRALLLTGKPIGEKVASHGPFVMNDETQILQAMRDYQMGKMGVLIEP